MFFYVTYRGNTLSGFIQSSIPRNIPNATEVSEEKFKSLGGVVYPERTSEVHRLEAMIKAQSDRAEFIEDCIAEMAEQVYGGV